MNKAEFVALYYPGWHKSDYRKDCDEWEILTSHCPFLPSQDPLALPIHGQYSDDTRESLLSDSRDGSEAGISAFQYFYYFKPPHEIMASSLRRFVRWPEIQGPKSALCWCARLPYRVFPVEVASTHKTFKDAIWHDRFIGNRLPYLSMEEIHALCSSWCSDYCSSGQYFQINNRPLLSLLNLSTFVGLYGLDTFQRIVVMIRGIFQEQLNVQPFVVGVCNDIDQFNLGLARDISVDAISAYGLLPRWNGPRMQDYSDRIEASVEKWYLVEKFSGKPFLPVIVSGWDATSRGRQFQENASASPLWYPLAPIITGVTKEAFGKFADYALSYLDSHPQSPKIIFVYAWNEWTEGAAIAPSNRFGSGLANEIRRRSIVR
jgi:hypothetical protein